MTIKRSRRSFSLIETVAALALLALLGVSILQVQSSVVRQVRLAQLRNDVANRVEGLLWDWRVQRVPVTLPATGEFAPALRWQRESGPLRIAQGVMPTEVRLTVFSLGPSGWSEVAAWSWLVPDPEPERRQ